MKNLKKLTPFKYFALTNFPYIEADFDALTNYELFCKIVEYVNSISASQNDVIDDFNELKAIVDALAEELHNLDFQEEVNNKLDEMAEDGTLENLILPYLASIVSPSRTLTLNRYGRFLDEYVKETRDRIIMGQCMCYYDGYYYTGGDVQREEQTISVWDSNGELVTYKRYTELYHCNGITADATKLYVACQDTNSTIAIIDKGTLDIIDLITFPDLTNIYTITEYNNTIYFLSTFLDNGIRKTKLHILNVNEETYETVAELVTPTGVVPQNFCIYNNKCYLLYVQSNSIYRFPITGGNYDFIYYIPEGDGLYPTGECEDLFVINDMIYLQTIPYSDKPMVAGESTASFIELFETDITKALVKRDATNYMGGLSYQFFTCDGNAEYTFNPQGTVSTLEELSVLASYHKNAVLVYQNTLIGFLYLKNGNYKIVGNAGDRRITNIHIEGCNVIFNVSGYLNKVRIVNSTFKGTNLVFNELIDINRSYFELDNCTISNVETFNILRSNIIIKNLSGTINSNLSFTISPTINTLEFKDTYKSNVLKLFECVVGSNGSGNSDAFIRLIKGSNNSIDDVLTRTALISGNGETGVLHNINNNSQYIKVRYINSNIYQVATDNTETELPATTLLEAFIKR